MTIEERINQALAERTVPTDASFERLQQYYEEKKAEGLIRKQEYTLPPMDTVGRTSCMNRRREDRE